MDTYNAYMYMAMDQYLLIPAKKRGWNGMNIHFPLWTSNIDC